MPVIRTTFSRDVWPATISTRDFATESASARNRTSASLAAPSTGGAVSLILSPPSSIVEIPFREARGWIRTERVADSADSLSLGRPFALITGLLEVDHLQVHFNDLFDVLQEVVLPSPELLNVRLELRLLRLGSADDLLTPNLGVLEDQGGLLARVFLDFLDEFLSQEHRVLDRCLLLVELAQTLVIRLAEFPQLRHFAHERFHLVPHEVEEHLDLGPGVAAKAHVEPLLLDVERGDLDAIAHSITSSNMRRRALFPTPSSVRCDKAY